MAEFNTWNHLQFNNNEGGLFLSYTNKNGAKVAAALRRIFPSQGVRFAQSIELIMAGPMEGSIVCQTPKVFSINCGELPSGKTADQDGVAGVWYAENGDIVLNAPNGTIRLLASNIELISDGNPVDGKGNVSLSPSASLRCEGADQIKLYGNETRIKGTGVLNLEGNDEVEIAGGVKITEPADIISSLISLGGSRSPKEFIKNLLRFKG
tara:strand:- start:648 stop:1274 length:627 start_codon:yes stop_codon:yes gene_type:complete